jgi:drug/metabolite transporter (DMT)-like permease
VPLVFLAVGILFLVLARNGTQGDFEQLLKADFVGSQSFLVWGSAILILGLVGFFKPVRPISDALIGLIILVLILGNSGAFANFNAAIRNPTAPTPDPATPTAPIMPTIQPLQPIPGQH